MKTIRTAAMMDMMMCMPMCMCAFAYPKRFVFSHVHVILRGF